MLVALGRVLALEIAVENKGHRFLADPFRNSGLLSAQLTIWGTQSISNEALA